MFILIIHIIKGNTLLLILIGAMQKHQRIYPKYFIREKFNPTEKDLLIIVDINEISTWEGIKYIKK